MTNQEHLTPEEQKIIAKIQELKNNPALQMRPEFFGSLLQKVLAKAAEKAEEKKNRNE